MELVIDGVSKLYKGKIWGLRDFSLELRPGVLGLVGPNGAGKTGLMRILATAANTSVVLASRCTRSSSSTTRSRAAVECIAA